MGLGKDVVTWWVYGDHQLSDSVQNQVKCDAFAAAHDIASAWLHKNMALVHIRKMTYGGDGSIVEQLVWAAPTPGLDWR